MRVTKMRVDGKKLGGLKMANLIFELKFRFEKAGFITGVGVTSDSGLKIGLRQSSFKIDIEKHDRNLRYSPHSNRKLTSQPTWDQRVKFNDIINGVFNKFKVSANIKSGPFTIRQGTKSFFECDWDEQKPDYIRQNEIAGHYIESCNEREFLRQRQSVRNKESQIKRAKMKAEIEQRIKFEVAS